MVTIDLDLTLRVILYLVAIVFLLSCICLFTKLIKAVARLNRVLEKSEESIVTSVEKIPGLLENADKAIANANEILGKTDKILNDTQDDITDSIENGIFPKNFTEDEEEVKLIEKMLIDNISNKENLLLIEKLDIEKSLMISLLPLDLLQNK